MQPMWLVMLPQISTDQLDVADVIQGQVKNNRFSRLLALYSWGLEMVMSTTTGAEGRGHARWNHYSIHGRSTKMTTWCKTVWEIHMTIRRGNRTLGTWRVGPSWYMVLIILIVCILFLTLNWREGSRRLRARCFHSLLGLGLLDDVGPSDLMQPMWLVMLPLISTDQLDVADVIQGQVKNNRFSRLLALYSEDWKWWCQQQLGQKEGAMQDVDHYSIHECITKITTWC